MKLVHWDGTCLYSSLTPYAMVISGSSAMTALAAAFMRSRARLSFGFSKPYLLANLGEGEHGFLDTQRQGRGQWMNAAAYLVNPLPSILMTIHVFGSSLSGCSNCLTYSNLQYVSHDLFAGNAMPDAYFELAMSEIYRMPEVASRCAYTQLANARFVPEGEVESPAMVGQDQSCSTGSQSLWNPACR